jgi:hypothetical protein
MAGMDVRSYRQDTLGPGSEKSTPVRREVVDPDQREHIDPLL